MMNWGMSGGPHELDAHRTHCDTETVITGASTPILQIGGSHTNLISQTYELQGPRLKQMLDLFDKASADIAGRNLAKGLNDPLLKDPKTQQMVGPAQFIPNNYVQSGCDDNIATHLVRSLNSKDQSPAAR